MHNVLYLLRDEQNMFASLDAALKEGWQLQEPEVVCHETAQELMDRYNVLTPNGVEFGGFIEKAKTAQTAEQITQLASELPVEDLTYEQMIDLYSLLGTKIMTGLVRHLLSSIKTDEDVEAVMTISTIRNAQFKANHSIRV